MVCQSFFHFFRFVKRAQTTKHYTSRPHSWRLCYVTTPILASLEKSLICRCQHLFFSYRNYLPHPSVCLLRAALPSEGCS